jgi:hypothetical protein
MAPGGDQGSMGWRHPKTFVLSNQFSFLFFFKTNQNYIQLNSYINFNNALTMLMCGRTTLTYSQHSLNKAITE